LLRGVQPGLLDRTLHPLKARLTKLLGTGGTTTRELERRVKVIHFASRRIEAKHFELLTGAVLERRRLRLTYRNRDRRDVTVREVSPQQLVHYRENWLLDAWCHSRDAIRSFALDAIEQVVLLDAPAEEVPPEVLDAHFRSGYGIYAGVADQVARLKFTPGQAQYVSLESWHHDQRSQWLPDGSYLLEVPYSSDAELVMDLMRHGAEVEVLGPPALRVKVAASLAAAASRYR
jgi:predicted DNA-binding transcriptional regulator YafY